jgi:hypothetical protein
MREFWLEFQAYLWTNLVGSLGTLFLDTGIVRSLLQLKVLMEKDNLCLYYLLKISLLEEDSGTFLFICVLVCLLSFAGEVVSWAVMFGSPSFLTLLVDPLIEHHRKKLMCFSYVKNMIYRVALCI